MPLMRMRRTSRVLGVVKPADGARVLRSGRRIWPNIDETTKVKRSTHDVVVDNKSKGNKVSTKKEEDFRVSKRRKMETEVVGDETKTVDKLFGVVYSRKRKRLPKPSTDLKPVKPLKSLKFYSRRRKRSVKAPLRQAVITLTIDWSCEECWFSTVLSLVMRYLTKAHLKLSSLASFFLTQPSNDVFTNHGVRFLAEPSLSSIGVFKFFGAMHCLPLLSADFTAIPRCFMDMHFTLLLRWVNRSLSLLHKPVEESDSESELGLSEPSHPRNGTLVKALSGGNVHHRGNFGFHSIQKRRSSLRRRRARNLSLSVPKLTNGTLVSELKNRTVSTKKLRSSLVNKLSASSNGISITPKPKTTEELDSLSCCVNVLVTDSDRCNREEGFSAMLEFSSTEDWLIVIKRNEEVRYSHKALKTMRPCSSNRFTQSIVWKADDNWKLEFCERQDWGWFKEIYKECYERNLLEQNAKVIPIPGVREVEGYAEDTSDFPSFSMPVSYISVKEDEVSRVMARTVATYEMDSEDEVWWEKQNKEGLKRDTFELMIDGFEKFYFHRLADDLLDAKEASVTSLSYLGSRQEVVEAVHGYWERKRKQRKAPLLRVFLAHQPKRTPSLSKSVSRKRRSFKRQGSQSKQLILVAEQDALEVENLSLRAEEAKAVAARCVEIAIEKRRRAQVLAQNADLAVYKSMMALKIAEAIAVGEPPQPFS